MSRREKDLDELTLLGNGTTAYVYDYDPSLLERIPNQHMERDTMVTLHCPEFTSLCPKTGQPDFAEIRMKYVPEQYLVESKSLKLYLFSFRNHGDFHEDCCNMILQDLVDLLQPRYMEVKGMFTPRGGISIWPLAVYGRPGTKYEQRAEDRLFQE